jgi:hypothetical protein
MAKQIMLTQNDYGISIRVTIDFDDETSVLSGKSVIAGIVAPDNTKIPVMFSILDDNTAEYVLLEENTNQSGLYKMYVSVLDEQSKVTAQKMVTYYCMAEDGGI